MFHVEPFVTPVRALSPNPPTTRNRPHPEPFRERFHVEPPAPQPLSNASTAAIARATSGRSAACGLAISIARLHFSRNFARFSGRAASVSDRLSYASPSFAIAANHDFCYLPWPSEDSNASFKVVPAPGAVHAFAFAALAAFSRRRR